MRANHEKLDPFHNFITTAELQGCLPEQALAGIMSKHTVHVYDMVDTHLEYEED